MTPLYDPPALSAETIDALGLDLTMLDADRLRIWAEAVGIYGPNISQWGDPKWVACTMRDIASRIESTVRDVGTLRAKALEPREPVIDCPACGEAVRQVASATLSLALWQHWNWACTKRESVRPATCVWEQRWKALAVDAATFACRQTSPSRQIGTELLAHMARVEEAYPHEPIATTREGAPSTEDPS